MITLGTASVGLPLLARGALAAQGDSEAIPEGMVSYLFVQSAHGAILADGLLRLSGVSPATIAFSDRPERFAGHVPTAAFIGHWSKGKDSFESDPPNAALAIADPAVPDDVVVVLKNPRWDGEDLIYDVDVLEGTATAAGGPASLFIDVIGLPWTPVSFAGTARRVTRRTWRRRAYYGRW
jgi:hypothetical protein